MASTTAASQDVPSSEWSLESDRLVIHRFEPREAHARFLVELYNSPLFIEREGKTGINTVEKAMTAISTGFIARAFNNNGHGPYIISLPSGEPIGSVTLMRGDYALPDIGFALLPAYTGKGYAREAGMRVIQYATIPRAEGGLGYAGVFGFADQSNELSRKVCARLGLQFKGVYELEAFGRRKSAVYASSGVELRETGIKEDRIDSD